MLRETRSTVIIFFIGFVIAAVVGLLIFRFGSADEPELGLQASAELASASGESIGTVRFTQAEHGVLIEAEASGLEPGGTRLCHPRSRVLQPGFLGRRRPFRPK